MINMRKNIFGEQGNSVKVFGSKEPELISGNKWFY